MTALLFFFSSRRRHTRWNCDWSSDVCSSDLSNTRGRLARLAGSWSTPPPMATRPPTPRGSMSTTVEKDRKSTRLNSSHSSISYAVFCLKKKRMKSEGSHDPQTEFSPTEQLVL